MKKTKMNEKRSSKPVALITGSASPLGSATSRKLASEGFNVALHYSQSKSKSLKLRKELEVHGAEVFLIQADLSDPHQSVHVVEQIISYWGRLDLVINNASLFEPTALTTNDWEKWSEIFNINTFSPVSLAMAAYPWLKKRRGCVINITDIYGELPILKEHAAYSASKAGLVFLTRYLAFALGSQVRVNAVSPGVITFPKHYTKTQKKELVGKSVLKRRGSPMEIANAVWFLVSNKFVTGQILHVDGGRFTT